MCLKRVKYQVTNIYEKFIQCTANCTCNADYNTHKTNTTVNTRTSLITHAEYNKSSISDGGLSEYWLTLVIASFVKDITRKSSLLSN